MPSPRLTVRDYQGLLLLTGAALALHGYHYGVQDQSIYLPAVKKLLDHQLYPHDAQFFLSQTRWMLFDKAVAPLVSFTGLSLETVLLAVQLLSIFLVLLGCLRIARRCFTTAAGQWAAVAMVVAVLVMPASGTRIPMVDNYAHPRNLAMAALLLAFPLALDRRPLAILGVALAAVMHPISAAIGAVQMGLAACDLRWRFPFVAAAAPLLGMPAAGAALSPTEWQQVLHTYRYYYLWGWNWYEWLGVAVPVGFLWWFSRRGAAPGPRLAGRMALSTGLFIAVAAVISSVPQLEPLVVLQPMRCLQLAFLFFWFFLAGWLAESWMQARPFRWAVFFLPACVGMTYFQSHYYPATPHFEWPGRAARNEWAAAFDWVRQNTPRDALFALDPLYLQRPGADSHGFRVLAERSQMVDYIKDRAVASLTPSLAGEWMAQWHAIEQWHSFGAADFARLRRRYGVTWVVVEQPGVAALHCPFQNARVRVCHTPESPPANKDAGQGIAKAR
jgi:hypothetical protein